MYKRQGFAKGAEVAPGVIKIDELIEKPGIEKRPSNLAVVSGFVFPPEIFSALESVEVADGQELVYVDGVNKLRQEGRDAYAVEIKGGKYYDCGNVSQYLKTNVEIALKRDDIGPDFRKFIMETADELKVKENQLGHSQIINPRTPA